MKILQKNRISKQMKYDAKIEPNATREQQNSGFGDYDADELILNRDLIPK